MEQQIKINYQNELSKFLKERKIVDPKILGFLSEMKNGNYTGKPIERKVIQILLITDNYRKRSTSCFL